MLDIKAMMAEKENDYEKLENIIQEKIIEHNKEIAELESERLRLQGEYRLLVKLQEEEAKQTITEAVEKSEA